ncbi:4'-phosphopantetheinyl transferase superfamily protein [Alkalilimnicola ehrlichii]|uniref:4'-phosphopantetheinyl transferase family protein n=1 Tax=Alkalilimnicola ehrlichii TaxID=351052 RepID=UPI0015F29DF4|nr:4'-phosphopantetheinyl transferase superfamily protein [Alkalilimnicola ehrlichii]
MLRATLYRYTGIRGSALQFRTNRFGRPYLKNRDTPQFNLSHTRGLVALAITHEGEVGVDVEDFTRGADVRALAGGLFSPAEAAKVDSASGKAAKELFFRLWTLKEAYVKARGAGLSMALDRFSFGQLGANPQLLPASDDEAEAERWRFFRQRLRRAISLR